MSHASPRRLALAGLVSLAVGNGIGRFVFTPILPVMMEALGLTPAQAGLIASANYAGYLAGALIGATSWLRGSPKAWLVGGLIASAITTAMVGLVPNPDFISLTPLPGLAAPTPPSSPSATWSARRSPPGWPGAWRRAASTP